MYLMAGLLTVGAEEMLNAVVSWEEAGAECGQYVASNQGFWAQIDETTASFLAARCFKTKFAMGDELIAQGVNSSKIGIIAEGLVKVCMLTEDGDEFVLQLLGPGQIVGGIDGSESAFSWEAATTVEMCWAPLAVIDVLMREKPESYKAFLAMTSQQLADMRRWAAAMRGRNTLQRIAYWLLQQIEGTDTDDQPVIHIDLTRRDLASFLDMTSETLCRGLSQLAARGAVKLRAVDLVELSDTAKVRLYARCPGPTPGQTLSESDLAMHSRRSQEAARHADAPDKKSSLAEPSKAETRRQRSGVSLSTDNAPTERS